MIKEIGKATTPKNTKKDQQVREFVLKNHVGLEDLPYQIVKQHLAQGFNFNIMCIGETGIGKSTLISSLFDLKFDSLDTKENVHSHRNVMLRSEEYNLQEKGVNLDLTVVETVGYGDQIQREGSYEPIISYIDSQFDKYLEEELNPRRQLALIKDTRIQVCLFFICPTGHKLKSLDLLCLKQLGGKVNVIPIIAKADTLSKDELQAYKSNIRMELEKENIQIYRFPTDDESLVENNSTLNAMIPFAVVGSNDLVVRDGKLVRGRNYPWGIVHVKDENHSDTSSLLKGIIDNNMMDLKEQTHFKHYENYRKELLSAIEQSSGNGMDVWNFRSDEVRKEFQRQEEKLMQDFVEKAKRFEREMVHQEKTMKDKYERMEQNALEEKIKLEEESRQLDLEIELFRMKGKEKKFAKGDVCDTMH
ncbi:hypothetical protein JTE90_020814 [Oedothorax gibbosus]|uniref:Septin n=1 Tax=Oedothorax gibbosus TaxID=931172 RepID=A0AAV6U878_9ARAC|nr:hypothetical protein JTE90_020814 [Oedothorax gibbosus]